MQSEVNVKKQGKIDVTTGSSKKLPGRMPNWKSPGPDLAQEFWLKNFSSLHERVRLQLKECSDSGFVTSWLTLDEGLHCYRKIRIKAMYQVIIDL